MADMRDARNVPLSVGSKVAVSLGYKQVHWGTIVREADRKVLVQLEGPNPWTHRTWEYPSNMIGLASDPGIPSRRFKEVTE